VLEVDAPKGNADAAWERIRELIKPLPRRFPEKRAREAGYRIALEYNVGLASWTGDSAIRREASKIAKRAPLLSADLADMSTGLRLALFRRCKGNTGNTEILRAANLDSFLSVHEALDEKNEDITSWSYRLSALAKLNEMIIASSGDRRMRKEPFLKAEMAFDCLCFLAACGKSCPLKRKGDVAALAAAEFEWATGKKTIADEFDGQMEELKKRRLVWRKYLRAIVHAGDWDDELHQRAEAIVRGDWPLLYTSLDGARK
jgi:hypothetical protein